ncbi:MAG: serine hydrolase domain-containing protein [Arachnia sp.]
MTMPRSTPSAEGVDAKGLLALLDAFEAPGNGYHSLMIARHGKVIAEGWWTPYGRDRVHLAYSLSKSFTSTVLGHLVGEGVIDLDAPVWSYLADLDTIPEKWREVTVRHCITMTVGHSADVWDWRGDDEPTSTTAGDELFRLILEREPDDEPGEVWAYNQVGTYLVAQAIAAATGEPVTAHVRRLLLDPFGGAAAKAQRTWQGRDLGFSGMHMTTPSILALAQTWLDGGVWQGQRIVPEGYAADAPKPSRASLAGPDDGGDWSRGYGASFWSQAHGYRGDGAFGQFAVVLPEQDVAVAITSETEIMQDTLDLLWRHLLPAIDAEPDPSADEELALRLARLECRPLSGTERRDPITLPRDPSSHLPETFSSATLEPAADGHVLRFALPDGELATAVGDGQWLESRWATPRGPELVLAASGAWRDGVFVAELRLAETPHTILVELDPSAGAARLNWRLVPLTGADPLSAAAFSF